MYHILIADDERIERLALEKTLSAAFGGEYQIHVAEDGRRALELFRSYPIGTAILDIEMPVLNGIDTAQVIFAEDPACRILFLTAFDRFDYARKAIAVRAVEYLLKPYEDAEVVAAVEAAIHTTGPLAAPAPAPAADSANRGVTIAACMEEYIRSHYQQDISMQDAACALNYSEPYFCKIFKQQFGQSFTAYLAEYRVRHAQQLLCQPTVNIKDIGMRVGYSDANYFAKVFRRLVGQSPSEYRAANLPPATDLAT